MWLAMRSCNVRSRTSRRSSRVDDCSVKMRAAFFDSSVEEQEVLDYRMIQLRNSIGLYRVARNITHGYLIGGRIYTTAMWNAVYGSTKYNAMVKLILSATVKVR